MEGSVQVVPGIQEGFVQAELGRLEGSVEMEVGRSEAAGRLDLEPGTANEEKQQLRQGRVSQSTFSVVAVVVVVVSSVLVAVMVVMMVRWFSEEGVGNNVEGRVSKWRVRKAVRWRQRRKGRIVVSETWCEARIADWNVDSVWRNWSRLRWCRICRSWRVHNWRRLIDRSWRRLGRRWIGNWALRGSNWIRGCILGRWSRVGRRVLRRWSWISRGVLCRRSWVGRGILRGWSRVDWRALCRWCRIYGRALCRRGWVYRRTLRRWSWVVWRTLWRWRWEERRRQEDWAPSRELPIRSGCNSAEEEYHKQHPFYSALGSLGDRRYPTTVFEVHRSRY